MTYPALPHAPHPPALQHAGQDDALAPLHRPADSTTGMTAASSPTWQRSAVPDPHRRAAAANIAAEDWDLLFCAALERLTRVAVENPAPGGTGVRLQAPPGTALRECRDALDQLRRSVPPRTAPADAPGAPRGG